MSVTSRRRRGSSRGRLTASAATGRPAARVDGGEVARVRVAVDRDGVGARRVADVLDPQPVLVAPERRQRGRRRRRARASPARRACAWRTAASQCWVPVTSPAKNTSGARRSSQRRPGRRRRRRARGRRRRAARRPAPARRGARRRRPRPSTSSTPSARCMSDEPARHVARRAARRAARGDVDQHDLDAEAARGRRDLHADEAGADDREPRARPQPRAQRRRVRQPSAAAHRTAAAAARRRSRRAAARTGRRRRSSQHGADDARAP